MNRIASDEPDEVGILPKPISFWHHGKQYEATVASSALKPTRILQQFDGGMLALVGDFGRAWLCEPEAMSLQSGLHALAMGRSEERKREREIKRRITGRD